MLPRMHLPWAVFCFIYGAAVQYVFFVVVMDAWLSWMRANSSTHFYRAVPLNLARHGISPCFLLPTSSVETNNSLFRLALWNTFCLSPFASQCCGTSVPVPFATLWQYCKRLTTSTTSAKIVARTQGNSDAFLHAWYPWSTTNVRFGSSFGT